jgi:hypothetical protein
MLADSPVVKQWLEPFNRSAVAMIILAVGLILGIVVIALPLSPPPLLLKTRIPCNLVLIPVPIQPEGGRTFTG